MRARLQTEPLSASFARLRTTFFRELQHDSGDHKSNRNSTEKSDHGTVPLYVVTLLTSVSALLSGVLDSKPIATLALRYTPTGSGVDIVPRYQLQTRR
jgi:hypothetical protein